MILLRYWIICHMLNIRLVRTVKETLVQPTIKFATHKNLKPCVAVTFASITSHVRVICITGQISLPLCR